MTSYTITIEQLDRLAFHLDRMAAAGIRLEGIPHASAIVNVIAAVKNSPQLENVKAEETADQENAEQA